MTSKKYYILAWVFLLLLCLLPLVGKHAGLSIKIITPVVFLCFVFAFFFYFMSCKENGQSKNKKVSSLFIIAVIQAAITVIVIYLFSKIDI